MTTDKTERTGLELPSKMAAVLMRMENAIAASLGHREAANAIFDEIAEKVEADEADEADRRIIVRVFRKIAKSNQALKYYDPEMAKSRSKRSFTKTREIFLEVASLHDGEGVPLLSNNRQAGAFAQVAENSNHLTETAVKRHYYDYKDAIDLMLDTMGEAFSAKGDSPIRDFFVPLVRAGGLSLPADKLATFLGCQLARAAQSAKENALEDNSP